MPSNTILAALALYALGVSLQGCGSPPDNRPRCQELLIADTGNHRILKCVGGLCSQVAGTVSGSGDDQFNTPVSVAVDFDGDYLVSDYGNRRIMKCPSASMGACTEVANTRGYSDASPYKVTLLRDGLGEGGYVWTFNTDFRSSGGQVCDGEWVCRGLSPDLIYQEGSATDANGDVLVLDRNINGGPGSVWKYVFSQGAPSFTATVSQVSPRVFVGPDNLAVDADGNYLVVDASAHAVVRCPPDSTDGPCETLAGQDGQGSSLMQLNSPADIVVDVANRFYVADRGNNRILLCDASACIGVDGLEGDFALSGPRGVAVGDVVLCPELPNATASEPTTASEHETAYFSTVV